MEKKKRGRPLGKKPVPVKRKCVTCKEIQSIDEFYCSKSHPGGHVYICKTCNTVIAHTKYIESRLIKHGHRKILQEINELRAGINLRWAILDEHLNK